MSYLDPQTQSIVLSATWRFDTAITAADPGARNFKFDNVTLASVLNIYISSTSDNRGDLNTILGALASGQKIYVQQTSDADNAALFTVGVPVDNTGWWTIPVTVDASNTLPVNNATCAFVMSF
jgi:hypothetical protein